MRTFVIFGAGQGGVNASHALPKRSIECFLDNDPNKWGLHLRGIPVRAPDSLAGHEAQVLIASVHAERIYQQLLELGVQPERIQFADKETQQGRFAGAHCLFAGLAIVLGLGFLLW